MKAHHSKQPDFGRRLRERREKLGMTQREVAASFVSSSYISLLEAGRRLPTLDLLVHLAEVLDMPLEQLSGEQGAPGRLRERDGADVAGVLTQHALHSAIEVGDYEEAASLLGKALEATDNQQEPYRSLEVGLQLQKVLQIASRSSDRLALLERLVDTAAVTDSAPLQVALVSELATAQRDTGNLLQARKSAHTAWGKIELAGLSGTAAHVRLLGILISVLCELGELDQVESLVDEMLELASSTSESTLGRSHWVASMAYAQLGRHEAAHRHLVAARESLTTPTTPLLDWTRFIRSTVDVQLAAGKDLDTAREWLEVVEFTTQMMSSPHERIKTIALRARYEMAAGNPRRAVELYNELEASPVSLASGDLVRARLTHSAALHALDRHREAEELLRSTADLCEQMGAYQLGMQIWKKINELQK